MSILVTNISKAGKRQSQIITKVLKNTVLVLAILATVIAPFVFWAIVAGLQWAHYDDGSDTSVQQQLSKADTLSFIVVAVIALWYLYVYLRSKLPAKKKKAAPRKNDWLV